MIGNKKKHIKSNDWHKRQAVEPFVVVILLEITLPRIWNVIFQGDILKAWFELDLI